MTEHQARNLYLCRTIYYDELNKYRQISTSGITRDSIDDRRYFRRLREEKTVRQPTFPPRDIYIAGTH